MQTRPFDPEHNPPRASAALPPAVILAGGLARRMGGGDKGALRLAGRSLMDRVIDRARPQCAALALNANGVPARFDALGLCVLADPVPDHPGPLAGVLAAMIWARAQGAEAVLTLAADTPFFPADLAQRLMAARTHGGTALAASADAEGHIRDHPTFALWPTAAHLALSAFLAGGGRRMRAWTETQAVMRVVWPSHPFDPFFNINTSDDLTQAAAICRDHAAP